MHADGDGLSHGFYKLPF